MNAMKTIVTSLLLLVVVLGCSSKSPISEKEAKKIAVADAGATIENVTFTRESYDKDDQEYQFSFYNETYQYEYEINGMTKEIESRKKEQIAQPEHASPQPDSGNEAVQKYIAIALEHFNLTADDVTNITAKQETEDGIAVYEVKFYKDSLEYKCEIRQDNQTIYHSEIDHD